MSLKRWTYCWLVLAFTIVGGAKAQTFTDQGLLSGSGLTILPTATLAPPMEYRVQYSRISYLKGTGRGLNVISMTAGLSTTIECYFRFGSEQSESFSSQIAYGVGGKFRLPVLLPVIRRLALWADLTSTEQVVSSALYPSDAFRAGAVATFDSNGIHPTLLVGTNRIGSRSNLLVGAGVTIASGNSVQLGLEAIHGYLGSNSLQIAPSGSVRIMSNIGLQVSPAYLSLPSGATWSISLGFSLTTADIDFHPVPVEDVRDEFILPSIEEIENEGKGGETNQPNGDGSMLDGTFPENGIQLTSPPDGESTPKETGVKDQSAQKLSIDNSTDEKPEQDELEQKDKHE